MPDYIAELEDKKKVDEFHAWASEKHLKEHGSWSEEPTTMYLKDFVEYFNIPKEDFVAAVEKAKLRDTKNGIAFDTREDNEYPNADIIYTFDDEIIDYYYRRE
jgi:hypothetical protein